MEQTHALHEALKYIREIQEDIREVLGIVRKSLKHQERIMSGIDDMKAALAASRDEIDKDFALLSDKINTLAGAATGDNDADVEVLAQELMAQVASMRDKTAAVLTPTPTPAPAPAPGPAPAPDPAATI